MVSATFPNPANEMTLKPLPANNSSPSVCISSSSINVSQSWTNSLPTNNGLHNSTKNVTLSPVVCTNSKESNSNTIANLSSLPTLPALNKTTPSSMVHINKNSNITVKLGEEVKLLNHVTSTLTQQNLSFHNAAPQHGTVLITKQGGNMLLSKPVVSEGNVVKQVVTLASSGLLPVTSAIISSPLSATSTVTSVIPNALPVTNFAQHSAVASDISSLLQIKKPKPSIVIKTEETSQTHQQAIPSLVSAGYATCDSVDTCV